MKMCYFLNKLLLPGGEKWQHSRNQLKCIWCWHIQYTVNNFSVNRKWHTRLRVINRITTLSTIIVGYWERLTVEGKLAEENPAQKGALLIAGIKEKGQRAKVSNYVHSSQLNSQSGQRVHLVRRLTTFCMTPFPLTSALFFSCSMSTNICCTHSHKVKDEESESKVW